MISNFILVYFIKNKNNYYKNIELPKWYGIKIDHLKEVSKEKYWNKLLLLMQKQIRILYPKTKIHILTNKKISLQDENLTFHYFKEHDDLLTKYKVLNLIDEPAMYLDLDILLNKKFSENHLDTEFPFNLFRRYKGNLPAIQKIPGLSHIKNAYNSGIIWVKHPIQNIEFELYSINKKYFSDQSFLSEYKVLSGNDEHAISTYIANNNFTMKTFEEVSKPRDEISNINQLKNYQSVHYMGIDKVKLNKEFFIINKKLF